MSFDAGTLMVALEHGNPILPRHEPPNRTAADHDEPPPRTPAGGDSPRRRPPRGWVSPRIGVGEPATPSTPRPGASFNWSAFPERLPQKGNQGRHGRRQGFVETG